MKKTRVLGVDLGLKRTGLAISDELGISVRILPNLRAQSRKEAIIALADLCATWEVATVLIGYPAFASVEKSPIASRSIGLKKALDEYFLDSGADVQVLLWDESLTSKAAIQQLVARGTKRKKRRHLLDGESAAILVTEYLTSHPVGQM